MSVAAAVEAIYSLACKLRFSTRSSGIFIVVDELGKFLEHASRGKHGDIFVLQQLAEATEGGALQLLTVLHQSFERYSGALSPSEQDEWRKVQGRFEELSFQESTDQLLRVIASAIRHDTSEAGIKKLRADARSLAEHAIRLQLMPPGVKRPDFVDLMVNCAPLHPLTVLALARLCNKFGQNHRSLFAFLTSHEPFSLTSFLPERHVGEFYCLHHLYDYAAGSMGAGLSLGENATRWAEIQSALDKNSSAAPSALATIKTIGLLSATGHYAGLKPSKSVLQFALGIKCQNHLEGPRPRVGRCLSQAQRFLCALARKRC